MEYTNNINFIKNKNININGILLLDKPSGISSNKVIKIIKWLINPKKIGYIGTLDPIANGILPICFGKLTKYSSNLSKSSKEYLVKALLGISTNTYDSEGIITKKNINFNIKINDIFYSLKKFIGKIKQFPPIYSSKKYLGKPFYKYARLGINIPISYNEVTIYNIKILNFNKNLLKLKIVCSEGTYIRSIINDLGNILECGAHIVYIRRTNIFIYKNINLITINKFKYILKNKYKEIEILKKLNKYLIDEKTIIKYIESNTNKL